MSQESTLAERVEALEREVAFLKMRLLQMETHPDWVEQISGCMKDFPEFKEVIKYGQEFRYADRPPDEEEQTEES